MLPLVPQDCTFMMNYISIFYIIFTEFLLESDCTLRGILLKAVNDFKGW